MAIAIIPPICPGPPIFVDDPIFVDPTDPVILQIKRCPPEQCPDTCRCYCGTEPIVVQPVDCYCPKVYCTMQACICPAEEVA